MMQNSNNGGHPGFTVLRFAEQIRKLVMDSGISSLLFFLFHIQMIVLIRYKRNYFLLNFQITWTIILIVCAILILAVIGIFLLIGFGIAWLILVIIGTTKANQGTYYRYPMSIRFIN